MCGTHPNPRASDLLDIRPVMSWLWGNETTEQAQFVVSALQGELDERESKIKALEAALKREQQDLTAVLEDEVKELEMRRQVLQKELDDVNALIVDKKELLLQSKTDGNKQKKTKKKKKSGTAKMERGACNEAEKETGQLIATQKEEEKPPAAVIRLTSADVTDSRKKVLPMDQHLKQVAEDEPNVAFIIQRSNNSNTVVYAGCKSADGDVLDRSNPIKVYWIMFEKEGKPREELNMIERTTAYGVTSKPSDVPGEFMVAIASLRDRDCTLRLDEHGNVMALTTIDGKKGMLLRRVFVQMTTSWGIPTVDYVDIFGVDPKTLAPVYEKKKNK